MMMPAWVSRCHIKITNIKAERLQDISERDAIAEGVYQCPNGKYWTHGEADNSAVVAYMKLWDRINPKHPRSSNPWVFAYTFEVVDGT